MRWREEGFNHLLHLRLAWVNQRFDASFSDEPLTLSVVLPQPLDAPLNRLNKLVLVINEVKPSSAFKLRPRETYHSSRTSVLYRSSITLGRRK
jgi:hypothetical protein